MAGLVVYQDSYIGATIVSNRFIDEYMTDANDAQLKVYLYLVRMLNAHLETSISDIADRFNHTEKDVVRAFKYWEKKGLLSLDYDEEKSSIVGVHLVNLCNGESKVPSVESTHKKVRTVRQKTVVTSEEAVSEMFVSDIESDASESLTSDVIASEGSNSVYMAVSESESRFNSDSMCAAGSEYMNAPSCNVVERVIIPAATTYTARELQEFSKRQGCTLVSLAEVYFGKPLSAADLQILCYLIDGLGMSEDLVDYLLQYCADKGKKDFRYAEKVAISWKEKNVTTVEQAEGSSLKYDKSVYTIMNRLGKSGSPTGKEMEFINRWVGEYGFSENVILEACDKTVLATDSHRFQYAEGILGSWYKKGVKSLTDITKLDEEFQKKDSPKKPNGTGSNGGNGNGSGNKSGGGSAGSFGKFQQTDIDYDALSKKIFVN